MEGAQDAASRNSRTWTKVGVSELAVTSGDALLSTSGLGSCVAVVLYEPASGVAGLLHAMLPEANSEPAPEKTGKFVDTGVAKLVAEMEAEGANCDGIRGKIVGGSDMLEFGGDGPSIGERNVTAALDALETRKIPVVAKDIGGTHGRSIRFDTVTDELTIRTAYEGETSI